jgi:hypothetical protein
LGFGEIANGEHLWVTEYPPEIGKFIDARKKKKTEETIYHPINPKEAFGVSLPWSMNV